MSDFYSIPSDYTLISVTPIDGGKQAFLLHLRRDSDDHDYLIKVKASSIPLVDLPSEY